MGKLRQKIGAYSERVRQFVMYNVLHANDPPHRLAIGIALGTFVAFTPTFGFQMVLVAFGAWILGANKIVGLPIVWISNPATMVPIYYWCFEVGRSIMGGQPMGSEWWSGLSQPPAGWWPRIQFYWSELIEIAVPLCFGSLVIGLVAAFPAYYAAYYLIRGYRLRRWGQMLPPKEVRLGRGCGCVGMDVE